MLELETLCFENSVDPDLLGLGSQLIRIHNVYHTACKYMLTTEFLQANWLKIEVCRFYQQPA